MHHFVTISARYAKAVLQKIYSRYMLRTRDLLPNVRLDNDVLPDTGGLSKTMSDLLLVLSPALNVSSINLSSLAIGVPNVVKISLFAVRF